nr:hypothetical protein [uncultured Carboxylicivirga sp.]
MEKVSQSNEISYKLYGGVFALLVIITLGAVGITRFELDGLPVITAIGLAVVSAGILMVLFMRIKLNTAILKTLLAISLLFLLAIIAVSFLNYQYH